MLTRGDEGVADEPDGYRAEYELDGYLVRPGQIAGAGEIRATPEVLKLVFGSPDLHLRTEDGRILKVRFSEKQLGDSDAAASVEVTGDLPGAPDWEH